MARRYRLAMTEPVKAALEQVAGWRGPDLCYVQRQRSPVRLAATGLAACG